MEAANEIILYQPDSTVKLEVRLEDETVWLSQEQMSELFQRDRTVIGRHINNIYKEGELERDITCANFAHMGSEGDQQYVTTLYNLDVIISVGYRVKSKRGTEFRQWATKVLREYLLRGYSINQRLMHMENRIDNRLLEHDKRLDYLTDKVDFFVRTSMPPVNGILFDGRIFDAYVFVCGLIESARERIILIDNYADYSTLTQLDKRSSGVSAVVYTSDKNRHIKEDLKRHNSQYPPIEVKYYQNVHDRFLIIDDAVYLVGGSFKDLGKKLVGFAKMESVTPKELIGGIKVKNDSKSTGGGE